MGSRKAQITIFVVLSLVIVFSIIFLIFFHSKKEPSAKAPINENPKIKLRSCIRESVESKIKEMLPNSVIENPVKTIRYHGKNITYICYQDAYYLPCYALYPELIGYAEKVLRKDLNEKFDLCLSEVVLDLESRGFKASAKKKNLSLFLLPKRVFVEADVDLTISKGKESKTFGKIETNILSPFYDLLDLTLKISSAESTYCYFENIGYMALHPEVNIRRIAYKDSKIYWLKDVESNQTYNFAVRSCAIRTGI